ncbi:hypothetical protein D4S03_03260, partial [bacterium]
MIIFKVKTKNMRILKSTIVLGVCAVVIFAGYSFARASYISGPVGEQGVAPAAPAGVEATKTGTANQDITLTWSAVANVDGYKIYRTKDSGSAELVGTVAALTYVDSGLGDGIYSYQVKSYKGALSTDIATIPLTAGITVTLAPPVANPAAGSYTATQSATLSAPAASSIRYTVDGTAPNCSSATYSTAISVTATKTIKALACYAGSTSSATATFTFTLSVVDGTTADVSLSSSAAGQADLPSGGTNVTLSNSTTLDLSSGVSTAAGGNITVGGSSQSLSNFTSGNLSGTDLSVPQTVGGQSVIVNKAVVLQSGIDTQPINMTNSSLAGVSVTIPDATTVLAPAAWDGRITPPRSGTSSGTAPSGFSVGSTVIEVGSSAGVLLFDQPVAIVLTGVTGSVGYKPAGSSTWVQITAVCGGTYTSPAAPTFPGECYRTNGTDTKIYTYHFTTFASLNT